MMVRILRYLWASPYSLLGLFVALLALPGGTVRFYKGVVDWPAPL